MTEVLILVFRYVLVVVCGASVVSCAAGVTALLATGPEVEKRLHRRRLGVALNACGAGMTLLTGALFYRVVAAGGLAVPLGDWTRLAIYAGTVLVAVGVTSLGAAAVALRQRAERLAEIDNGKGMAR